MIYVYIWDPDTVKKAFQDVRSRELCHTPWLVQCEGKRCQCFKFDEMPLYVQHQVVGINVAREVVTAYYKTMYPESLEYDIHDLHTFLTRDHFHLGLIPADHIRRLCILISPVHNSGLAMQIQGNTLLSSDGQHVVRTSLKALSLVPNKKGFRLNIVFSDGIWMKTLSGTDQNAGAQKGGRR